MRKVWLVIKREYLTRIRSKAFIFTTVGLPVFSVGIMVFSIFMMTRQGDHTLKIALIDNAGLANAIVSGLKAKLMSGQPLFQVVRVLERPASAGKAREELAAEVRRGQLDGYLVVPDDVLQGKAGEFHTRNPGDFMAPNTLRRALNDAVISRRLSDRGVQVEDLAKLVRGVDLTLIKITKGGEAEEKGQSLIVAFSLVMVLYITLLVYGVATMRSVLEEKTSRVVEVLVSSAQPYQLLTGKILGVAAVGLTQYLIWTVTGALVASYGGAMAAAFRPGASPPQIHLPFSLLVYALLFFLAGYFLFAALYAAVGAMVSSEEESQQVQLPITFIIVLAFLLYPVVMRDPSSRAAIIVSVLPFLSPVLMVFRIALQMPPFWQIALALGLSILTTVGVVLLSAKIYRVGILMYGKRPSLGELLRWLRYT
jgi:ABC-2 type transport system permease protein